MRKLLVILGAVLCLSLTAAAQDFSAGLDASTSASESAAPAPAPSSPSDRDPWQLGIGYQYQHYTVLGQTFHTNGFHTDITRYLNNWVGLEGDAVMGFGGNTGAPFHSNVKSLFVGGGLHIAAHNGSRFEPWIHTLVGWQHFQFAYTGTGLGSNGALGFMGGAGLDYKLGSRARLRIQGDYIGSHFASAWQSNYSFGGGLVFNF